MKRAMNGKKINNSRISLFSITLLTNVGVTAAILSAASLTAVGLGVAVLYILNPNAPAIINRYLPGGMQMPFNPTDLSTLEQIKAQIRQQGYTSGEMLAMTSEPDSPILIPLLKNGAACTSNCQQLSEFRLYQPDALAGYYELRQQLKIVGPDESFVLAPLKEETAEYKDSYRPLALNKLGRLDARVPGIWLSLTGDRTFGTTAIAYGQVFHYNPKAREVQKLLEWTSPAAQSIYWQQVVPDATPELVVNQTVGIEPMFRVYQVRSAKSPFQHPKLTQISLLSPAITQLAYRQALSLAKAGLWIDAYERLARQNIPVKTQPQVSLIKMHADFANSQLQQNWASPKQQLLVYLTSGRWQKGLELFDSSIWERAEILRSLRNDSGRLMRRIEIYLQVDPSDRYAKAWGAIVTAAQGGKSEAIAWLDSQPQTSAEDRKKISDSIELVNKAIAPSNRSL